MDYLDTRLCMSCTQLVAFKAFPMCNHASKPSEI
uniref:Uncharacterized protein n=1 Tax=Setaria italica TaxID=4555 RepID=K4ANB5_SETIT